MYHTLQIQVKQSNPLYAYLERTSHLANNLYNAGLFRCRQLITASKKEQKDLTENEKKVIKEFWLFGYSCGLKMASSHTAARA